MNVRQVDSSCGVVVDEKAETVSTDDNRYTANSSVSKKFKTFMVVSNANVER